MEGEGRSPGAAPLRGLQDLGGPTPSLAGHPSGWRRVRPGQGHGPLGLRLPQPSLFGRYPAAPTPAEGPALSGTQLNSGKPAGAPTAAPEAR
jgi:hypothetical protein